jgi:hypothetical protein
MEVWEWCSSTWAWNLSNHIVSWIDSSHTSIVVLWAINSWLGNLLWRSDSTVTCNIVKAVGWDIIRGSGIVSILISRLPVIPWLWVEVG